MARKIVMECVLTVLEFIYENWNQIRVAVDNVIHGRRRAKPPRSPPSPPSPPPPPPSPPPPLPNSTPTSPPSPPPAATATPPHSPSSTAPPPDSPCSSSAAELGFSSIAFLSAHDVVVACYNVCSGFYGVSGAVDAGINRDEESLRIQYLHIICNEDFGNFLDHITMSTAYQKMKTVCLNIGYEVSSDIEIHNQHILPSFVNLPNLSASTYSVELCSKNCEFLITCPPSVPLPHVAELMIAKADFQEYLASWKISSIKGGVDAKELFHLRIVVWIQDKHLALLESCKLDKVKWSGVRAQHSRTSSVDEMYDRLKEPLNDYEVIISRWPEYSFALENAVADVEKAIVEALDRQYSDVLAPLKETLGLKHVQKLAKQSVCPYVVPNEVGILLNSLMRMLDCLPPRIETQFNSWGPCSPNGGNQIPVDRLSEITVMLRAKFRNYLQAIAEKLVENLQSSMKIKKILQESTESVGEPHVRNRMQPLKEQLAGTINHLHSIFETHVFIGIGWGYWDRIGQDVLNFLENGKENRSWYKGSPIAVSVLGDTFGAQMQQVLGNALQEDTESPQISINDGSAVNVV